MSGGTAMNYRAFALQSDAASAIEPDRRTILGFQEQWLVHTPQSGVRSGKHEILAAHTHCDRGRLHQQRHASLSSARPNMPLYLRPRASAGRVGPTLASRGSVTRDRT